ncbi:MAG: CapA family protein [Victivallales bacterium]
MSLLQLHHRASGRHAAFIDAGAELVIGHHPHVIQGVEQYGNGWIAYSLGNLVFDSDYVAAYPNTDRGFLVSLAASHHHLNRLTLRLPPTK